MKKPFIALLCITMVLALVSGCAQPAQSSASTPAASASSQASAQVSSSEASTPVEAVTLQLAIYGDDARKKRFEELSARFTEQNPGINVEILLMPFGEFQQKLAILLAAKTAPDVTWLSEKMIPQFMESNSLVDISTALKEDAEYDFADIAPSSLDIYTRGEEVYGIPFSCGPRVYYYNIDMFKAKGLKTPNELLAEGNWTLDEMYKTAVALTDHANGEYGMKLFPATSPDDWINGLYDIVWSMGGDYFNQDMTEFTLNTPEGIAAMQYYYDMLFKDECHVKPGDLTQFESGKIGMARDFVSYSGQIRGKVSFEWDIAPNPVGPAGPDTKISVGQASYSVLVGKNEKEAIEVLKYFTGKEIMTELISSFICSRKSVLESEALLNQPEGIPTPNAMKIAVADPLSYPGSRALPSHENFQKIDVEMKKLYDMMYTKSNSVEEIVKMMQDTVNPLLK